MTMAIRCLVVDDDELGREMLVTMLEDVAACEIACNGREALEKFMATRDSNPYDLIFLDIVMPEMDGNEAAREIRRLELERGITPDKGVNIIVLTSLNTADDIIKAYVSAQSAAHLIKPVKPEKLKKTLRTLGLIPEEV
jgi:two-component system chemotaxis response regulator CheY